MRTRYAVFAVVLLLGAVQAMANYPRLPATVASHFGAAGQADGWMSREAFMAFMAALTLIIAAVFAVLPVLLMWLPVSLINLPNKDYWLAPPRRAQTMVAIGAFVLDEGILTMALLLGMHQLTIEANLRPPPQLAMAPFWSLLAAYLVFTGLWIVRLYRRFPKVQ